MRRLRPLSQYRSMLSRMGTFHGVCVCTGLTLAEWYHIRRVCDCAHVRPALKCPLGDIKSHKPACHVERRRIGVFVFELPSSSFLSFFICIFTVVKIHQTNAVKTCKNQHIHANIVPSPLSNLLLSPSLSLSFPGGLQGLRPRGHPIFPNLVRVRKIEAQFIKALPPFWQHPPDHSNLSIFHQLIKRCTRTHCTEPPKQATSMMYSLAIFTFMSHRHTSFEKAIYSQKTG